MGGQEKDGGGLGKGGGGWRDREEGREGGMQQVEEVEQATAWEEEEVEQVEEEGQCNCMGGVGSVHCTGYLLLPSSLGYNAFGKVARSNVIGVFAIQLYNNTYCSISFNITREPNTEPGQSIVGFRIMFVSQYPLQPCYFH